MRAFLNQPETTALGNRHSSVARPLHRRQQGNLTADLWQCKQHSKMNENIVHYWEGHMCGGELETDWLNECIKGEHSLLEWQQGQTICASPFRKHK